MPITQNTMVIAIINPATESLSYKEATFGLDGGQPIQGVEGKLKSHLPVVAVFDGRMQGQSDFWVVTEGNSLITLTADNDGNVDLYSHDTTGQGSTRIRRLNADGTAETPRTVPTKVSQATMGGGATWDVWREGSGTTYKTKVNEAIAYVNATYSPSAPIPPVS